MIRVKLSFGADNTALCWFYIDFNKTGLVEDLIGEIREKFAFFISENVCQSGIGVGSSYGNCQSTDIELFLENVLVPPCESCQIFRDGEIIEIRCTKREFNCPECGCALAVDPSTLIPRASTEDKTETKRKRKRKKDRQAESLDESEQEVSERSDVPQRNGVICPSDACEKTTEVKKRKTTGKKIQPTENVSKKTSNLNKIHNSVGMMVERIRRESGEKQKAMKKVANLVDQVSEEMKPELASSLNNSVQEMDVAQQIIASAASDWRNKNKEAGLSPINNISENTEKVSQVVDSGTIADQRPENAQRSEKRRRRKKRRSRKDVEVVVPAQSEPSIGTWMRSMDDIKDLKIKKPAFTPRSVNLDRKHVKFDSDEEADNNNKEEIVDTDVTKCYATSVSKMLIDSSSSRVDDVECNAVLAESDMSYVENVPSLFTSSSIIDASNLEIIEVKGITIGDELSVRVHIDEKGDMNMPEVGNELTGFSSRKEEQGVTNGTNPELSWSYASSPATAQNDLSIVDRKPSTTVNLDGKVPVFSRPRKKRGMRAEPTEDKSSGVNTNVSSVFQNNNDQRSSVESLIKQDYSRFPNLAMPKSNDKIAFKMLEVNSSYEPQLSDYKEGCVISFDAVTRNIEIKLQADDPKKGRAGKFDICIEDEDVSLTNVDSAETIEIQLSELYEAKLLL